MLILIFALGIVTLPVLARITRANALQWSQREFVMAARAQGATNIRTMVREVLPNVLPAMFSIALLGIAVVIVAGACGVAAGTPDALVGIDLQVDDRVPGQRLAHPRGGDGVGHTCTSTRAFSTTRC